MKPGRSLIVTHCAGTSSAVRLRTQDRHTRRALTPWRRPATVVLLAAGLALIACPPVDAQLPVIDSSNLVQQIKGYLQDLKSYATQLQQLQQEVQQVQWLISTYQSFVHDPSLGGAMALLNQVGIDNPLPVNPYAIQTLLNGQGGISGALGGLSTLSNSSFSTNHVYSPSDGSWASQQLNANGNGIAGAQGTALQIFQQVSTHYPVIQALRARLLAATTPKDVADAQAQIGAEQAWEQNATAQLQSVALLNAAQEQSNQQRQNEKLDQDIDAVLQAAPGGS
jgi:conjugal transfer/entry exclusion protein